MASATAVGATAALAAGCTIEVERDLVADAATHGAVSTSTLPSAGDSVSI